MADSENALDVTRTRRRRVILPVAAAAALLLMCLTHPIYHFNRWGFVRAMTSSPSWPRRVAEFNERKKTAASIFAEADRVETFRMRGDPRRHNDGDENTLEGFVYTNRGQTKGRMFANKLGSIVLEPRSYTYMSKACMLIPTVAFRIWRGKESVTVIICFNCDELVVLEENAPLSSFGGIEAHFKVRGDFDWFRPELLALAKETFPTDQQIQALPTYKHAPSWNSGMGDQQ